MKDGFILFKHQKKNFVSIYLILYLRFLKMEPQNMYSKFPASETETKIFSVFQIRKSISFE